VPLTTSPNSRRTQRGECAPIGSPHCTHDDIRREGAGRYSHWGDTLYFSTSDNTDPNRNGRAYALTVP
jgi:hypothetical protein